MRLKSLQSEDTLEVLAVTYRIQRHLAKHYNLTPIKSAIVTLLGSYAVQDRTGELAALSVGEIQILLSYSRSNSVALYYAVQELCQDNQPYIRKHEGRPALYSLTAHGVAVVREAIRLSKEYRWEVSRINTATTTTRNTPGLVA
jgi:hypothetical protein